MLTTEEIKKRDETIRIIKENILNKEPLEQERLLEELSKETKYSLSSLKKQLNKENEKEKILKQAEEKIKKERAKEETFKEAGLKAKKILNKKIQTKKYLKEQPYLYDSHKSWWLWSENKFKWIEVDEIDILLMLQSSIGGIDVTSPKERATLINELKQEGRKNFAKIKISGELWVQYHDTIIDIKTGKRFKATPEYFVCNPISWKLGKSKETPTIDRLFREWVIHEGIQDESFVKTLYQIICYCLLPSAPLQRIIGLVGHGANGKSTYLSLIEKFLGCDNCCSTELDILMISRFESSRLYKKLVVFIGEVDKGLFKKTSILKRLSGEDMMRIEKKGKDGFNARLYSKPLLATNKLPESTDTSIGFFRRWLIVDFLNTFEKQSNILNSIPNEEFENLALKSIDILQELLSNGGFINEGNFEERQRRYLERANPLDSFISDKCLFDDNEKILFIEFFEIYENWLKLNGFRTQTKRDLGIAIKHREPKVMKRLVKINTTDGKITTKAYVKGLKWKETDEINTEEGEEGIEV